MKIKKSVEKKGIFVTSHQNVIMRKMQIIQTSSSSLLLYIIQFSSIQSYARLKPCYFCGGDNYIVSLVTILFTSQLLSYESIPAHLKEIPGTKTCIIFFFLLISRGIFDRFLGGVTVLVS